MTSNKIHFTLTDNILFATASGELAFLDIINHYHELFDSPEFVMPTPAIYDFTNVSRVTGELSDFEKIASDMGNSQIVSQPCYVAIVLQEDNKSINSIFNAYCRMMDYTFMNVTIFHDIDKALNWIKESTHQ